MRSVVTIGFFDGVHAGHRYLVELLKNTARENNFKSVLLTFDKGPGKLKNLLTPIDEKLEILNSFEIDCIDVIKFDEKFKNLSPEEFFEKYLLSKYRMGKILVGHDFAFGRDRTGDKMLLKKLCRSHYQIINVNPVLSGKSIISSSLVRKNVLEGRVEQANELMGRFYSMQGRIRKGRGIGRQLGFPTANLEISGQKLLPKGVFTGYADFRGTLYSAVASIGHRPTVEKYGRLIPEVHLINFKWDVPVNELKFYFTKKLREEKKFSSIGKLIEQIKQDIKVSVNNKKWL